MAWFKRDKKSIEQTTPPEERRVRTEGLWVKCESCRTIVFRKDLEANLFVCPKCQFHFKMNSKQRLEMLLDGRWTEHDAGMTSTDPLKFVDTKSYASRLKDAKKKLGIGNKEVTADGQFSLEEVECIGACSWAPAVEINYDFHHFVTPEKLDQLIDGLRQAQ